MPNKEHFKPLNWILRYGAAVIAVAIATVLRLGLAPALGARLPFTTYFVTVILVSVYAGLGPALVTVALGATIGTYLFTPHAFGLTDKYDIPQIVAHCLLRAGL